MQAEDEKPPVFSRWRYWYWLLMLALLAQIFIYYSISRQFV